MRSTPRLVVALHFKLLGRCLKFRMEPLCSTLHPPPYLSTLLVRAEG